MPWKRRLLSLTFVMKAFHQVRLIWGVAFNFKFLYDKTVS